MTIRNVNDDSRSVKWRARKVINLSSISDWVLFFAQCSMALRKKTSASEVIRLWIVILTARVVNSIYDALKWKSLKQQSAREFINELEHFSDVFMVISASFSARHNSPRNSICATEKLSRKRNFCGNWMLLTRKHSLFLAEVKQFAVVEGRKNCPLAEKC